MNFRIRHDEHENGSEGLPAPGEVDNDRPASKQTAKGDHHIRIGRRFLAVFSVILLVAALGFAFIGWNLYSVRQNLVSLYEARLTGIDLLIEADRDAYQSNLALLQILSHEERQSNHEQRLGEVRENLGQVSTRFQGFIEAWSKGLQQEENSSVAKETENFNKYYPEFQAVTGRIEGLIARGARDEALRVYDGSYSEVFMTLRLVLDRLTIITLAEAEAEYQNSLDGLARQLLTSVATAVVILLVSFVMAVRLTSSVTRPLYAAVDLTNQLADGQMRVTIPQRTGDEFADLFASLGNLVSRVGAVVNEVKDSAGRLAAASEQMTATTRSFSESAQSQASATEEISATVEQISAGQEHVAATSGGQVSSINQMIERMEELSIAVREVGDQLSSHMSLARTVVELARTGETSLQQMTGSMHNINNSSSEVSNIVAIITGISEQINLLALNAAIEAARAGDAGRGFAVVADEIGRLADKTASSIKNIDSLIKANASEIGTGLASITSAVDVFSQIIDGVDRIGQMMFLLDESMKRQLTSNSQVNHEAQKVRELATEIKQASVEQETAVREVVDSVMMITESTTTVASGADEMAGSAAEIASMAEALNGRVHFFKS